MKPSLFLIAILFLYGCTPPEGKDFKSGQKEASQSHFTLALADFERSTKRNPDSAWALKSAREGARVAYYELKDYKRAAVFYRHIVLNSPDNQERIDAQKMLGEISLENLQDYPQAILEYSKLVQQNLPDQEIGQYRLGLARAYYFKNNLFQAESEIAEILKLKIDPPLKFSGTMLKGNILIAKKDFNQAAELFRQLMKIDSDKAVKENVPMTLAVCYEEAGDYKQALQVLENMRGQYSPPEYIELRIKRLKERQKNQPGAKGLRK